MFLKPYKDVVKIFRSRGLSLTWWPFAIVSFDTCTNSYLVDLLVASETTDPLPLILTMRRYRDKHAIEPSPPIEAPIIIPRSVGPGTILNMIYKIKREIEANRGREAPAGTQWIRSHRQQTALKRPSTLEEAVSNPISRGILSEILTSICISSDNVKITNYNPIHILTGINRNMKEFYLFMDKKKKSINHEIYVLTNKNIRALIEKHIKISTTR